jgi:hypothetical protein
MKKMTSRSIWIGIALLVGLLTAGTLFSQEPHKKRLALLPFQLERSEGSSIVRCRVCGNILSAGPIEGDPAEKLTRQAWELLADQSRHYELINPGQVEGVYQELLAKKMDTQPLVLAREIGRALQADGVVWGAVFRYEEREGTAYGVNRPAAVSLDLHLMRISDGTLVWKAQWSESQKSLSENLFQLGEVAKRGLRWMTAEEMARSGLTEMLKGFPGPERLQ